MISHADLLGINLDELMTERFDHPDQLKLHRQLEQQAHSYWNPLEPAPSPWIDLNTAGQMTHYHRNTIWRWVKSGLLPSQKVGHRVLIHEDVLKSFVATRREAKQKSE